MGGFIDMEPPFLFLLLLPFAEVCISSRIRAHFGRQYEGNRHRHVRSVHETLETRTLRTNWDKLGNHREWNYD